MKTPRPKTKDQRCGMSMSCIAHSVQILLILVILGAMPAAWGEPPERSIFRQAKLTEPDLEKPAVVRKKEKFLIQALGLGEIQIPEAYGRVVDVYEGKSSKTIIHIQDAHVHYEAQKNLAAILESLLQRNQVKLVLVEGGNLRGALSPLRKLASRQAREAVAERYLRKGLLAGDEYLELVSDYPMIRQGIEDPALYEENLRTFMEVERFKKDALAHVAKLRRVVEALKQKLYNPAHLELEQKRETYDTEKIDLVAYYQYLTSLKAPQGYPNIEWLLEASRFEKEITFDKVNDERELLIEALTEKLSEEEMKMLVAESLAYQEGTLSQNAYYEMLMTLAVQNDLPLETYPNLEKYNRYLSLYDRLHHSALFKEGDRLEEEIRKGFLGSEDERQLVAIDKQLKLFSNLLMVKISPDDYATYQKNRIRFSARTFLPFLQRKAAAYQLDVSVPQDAAKIDAHMKTLDRFYTIAQKRDLAFVENSLEAMDKEGVNVAVLKTGGFHTPGLIQILKEKGISYIVISPRITEAGNAELYYSVLKETSGSLVQ